MYDLASAVPLPDLAANWRGEGLKRGGECELGVKCFKLDAMSLLTTSQKMAQYLASDDEKMWFVSNTDIPVSEADWTHSKSRPCGVLSGTSGGSDMGASATRVFAAP